MPVFRNRMALEVAQGIRKFFKPEAGSTRTARVEPVLEPPASEADGQPDIRPENLVWIFGAGRTGSTWLMWMMRDSDPRQRYPCWDEPYLGELFGSFYNNARKDLLLNEDFILGESYREGWLRSIRNFALEGARMRFPEMTPWHYLIIKEPHGSVGAPLLVEALPESRVILLVRDPRDVVASHLDAAKKGGWMHQAIGESRDMFHQIIDDSEYLAEAADTPDRQRDVFVEVSAKVLMSRMMGAKRAYEAHRGPKVMVRYEDLRMDTLVTLHRIFDTLGLPIHEKRLGRLVENFTFENVPDHAKGEGKFFRKATPGGWQEDLTSEQAATVERISEPILEEFYGS